LRTIRLIRADTDLIAVVDDATGLAEFVEVSAVDETAVRETIIEDEPEVSGRYHYTP
jgi:hypothetical protein